MKLFTDWGFGVDSWQGRRGEYWVLAQILLILGFAVLPIYRPASWSPLEPPLLYSLWSVVAILGVAGLVMFAKGWWIWGIASPRCPTHERMES